MTSSSPYPARLPDLAVIDIAGADAASFLHSQLTNDVAGLASGQARLAGYCTAKGRLLGTMVVWRDEASDPATLRALVKADIAAPLIKRLSMFVLRAKASLKMADARVYGIMLPGGPDAGEAGPALQLHPPATPAQAWRMAHTEAGTWITAPSPRQDLRRWWLIAPAESRLRLDESEPPADTGAAALWRQKDIASGLPWVQAATQDLFIPQTMNLDLIDGVSFTKGCYPGQEVVARSHYRGTVKRRMAYGLVEEAGALDAESLPAVDTFDARQPDNPCGRVMNAVRVGPAIHLLMEVQLGDLGGADFRLGRPDGPAISEQPLPYPIKAEA